MSLVHPRRGLGCLTFLKGIFSRVPPLFLSAAKETLLDISRPPAVTRLPAGKRVLLMVDDDNLRLSAARHGCCVDYGRLVREMRSRATQLFDARAVLTSAAGDHRDADRLVAAGFNVLRLDRTYVPVVGGGTGVVGNDSDIVWELSRLVAAGRYDTIAIATGDGDLCICAAQGLARSGSQSRLVALGVAGSVSRRIQASNLFDGCVVLGRDFMLSTTTRMFDQRPSRIPRCNGWRGRHLSRSPQHQPS